MAESDDKLHRVDPPPREIQELWFALARRPWRSVVLVPADRGESTAGIAQSLVDMGKWLREPPSTLFVMSDPLDYASATQIVGPISQSVSAPPRPDGKTIVAVQPVIVEPLGLSVTQSADAVILCVQVGHTRMGSARRTIQLVGRERIAGAFVVHPGAESSRSVLARR